MDNLIHFSSDFATYYEDLDIYNEYIKTPPPQASANLESEPTKKASLPLVLSLHINDLNKPTSSKKLTQNLSIKPKRLKAKDTLISRIPSPSKDTGSKSSSQLSRKTTQLNPELKEEINEYIKTPSPVASANLESKPTKKASLPLVLSLHINDINKPISSKKLTHNFSIKPKRLNTKDTLRSRIPSKSKDTVSKSSSKILRKTTQLTKELKKEINEYILENPLLSQKQLSEYFGVNQNTFSTWVFKKKIQWNQTRQIKKVYTKQLAKKINTFIKDNPSFPQTKVADYFGINHNTFATWIFKKKIQWDKSRRKSPILTKKLAKKINTFIKDNPSLLQKEVAEHFGIEQSTFTSWATKNKIEWHQTKRNKSIYNEILAEKINAFIKENPTLSKNQVAQHFKINKHTFSTWICRNKIQWNQTRQIKQIFTEQLAMKINTFINDNPSLSKPQVAQHFKINEHTFSTWIRRNKIQWHS